MHLAARSLVRAHRPPIISLESLKSLNSRTSPNSLNYRTSPKSLHSLESLESLEFPCGASLCFASRRAIGESMAKLQPFLRVGARNMGGEAPLDIEVFGKAASGTGSPSQVRGDCPFSQRIYLDLEEKNVPYKATYIQEGNDKPDWFMAKNPSGLMPAFRDGEIWVQDSDKIAQYLEEKFPEPSLKTPAEFKNIGSGIFMAFTSWLKAKNVDDHEPKEALLKELKALDDHLKAHGPYIGGEKPTDSDFALIPKMKHLEVSLKYYYEWQIPSEFSTTKKYIELLESRPSFKKTDVPNDMIVQGWGKKFELSGKIVQAQSA